MKCLICGRTIENFFVRDEESQYRMVATEFRGSIVWIQRDIVRKGAGIYCNHPHCHTPMFTFDGDFDKLLDDYLMEEML